MKLIVAVLLMPLLAFGQLKHTLEGLDGQLTRYAQAEGEALRETEKLHRLVGALVAKKSAYKNDEAFVEAVFYKIHQRFLKTYKTTAHFNHLFEKGIYNCLTATALYSTVFSSLDFDTEIIETDFHIFMLVAADGKRILIETTDQLDGFITDEARIAEKIASYKFTSQPTASASHKQFVYQTSIFNRVLPAQLPGLIHYNAAVEAYNDRNFEKSIDELLKASSLYNSSRIDEFHQLLLATLLQSNIDKPELQRLLRKLQTMKASHVIAMNAAH
jgi:hypothetical protein